MAGEMYDAPNQQVVRPDGSGPWEEGEGGSAQQPKKTSRKRETPPAETQPEPVPEEPTAAG